MSATERERETMYAVIGDDGTQPVVWGLGASEAEALADAAMQNDGEDIGSKTVRPITEAQAERIRIGEVSCAVLGIAPMS